MTRGELVPEMQEDADATRPPSLAVAWTVAVVLGLLAGLATLLANGLLEERFPDAVRPDDLMFELLPYVRPARWLTVVALVVGFGAFLVDTLRHHRHRLPAAGAVLALMYLLRAGIMVLTPLGPAQGEGPFIFSPQNLGMFPSGHVAAVTVLALLTPADRPGPRRLQWAAVLVMGAALLLARGHYSIDVVGGMLLAFFVVRSWQDGRVLAPLARAVGGRPARHP